MKRGQGAMEFLMSYGWAILAVLITIGALAYFGVLTPLIYPRYCVLFPGVACIDSRVDEDTSISVPNGVISLVLRNGYGSNMVISDVSISEINCDPSSRKRLKGVDLPNTIIDGERAVLTIDKCATGKIGDRIRSDVDIKYTLADNSIGHARIGKLVDIVDNNLPSNTIIVNADAYVDNQFPSENTNYGGVNLILNGNPGVEKYMYFKFIVPSYQGTLIRSELKLKTNSQFQSDCFAVGGNYCISIYPVDSGYSWTENGITWNNQPIPSQIGSLLDSFQTVGIEQYVSFDVSNSITGPGTYTFVAKSIYSDDSKWHSKESPPPNQPGLLLYIIN